MKLPGVLVGLVVLLQPWFARADPDGKFHPLLPGIEAEPLPVNLPNCNNLLYRHDGKLVALGYNGNIYLLTDSDGDGAEDTADLFWESKGRLTGQIGMDLAPAGSPHGNAVFIAAKGKVVMIADREGDDRAEHVETLAEGWPPARAGVDVTGLTLDPRDGSVWFGLGVRLYDDAYEIEDTGAAQNDLSSERGAIHRISPDFSSREKICTGIRWPIALRFNREGDLFCTDQEGATWLPNGNPFDELLHIEEGRHYGFPPRHPKHLPGVIDEPSVFDYGPQHQSTCGMNFNEPVNGGPVFGPAWWAGDALVVGESRGKLYRTKLVKSPAGYVAHNEIIAGIGALAIDACVSPKGELRLCTHSGPPDWGTGPEGDGQIWRITYEDTDPQPVLAWRQEPGQVRVAFDRPFPASENIDTVSIREGVNVRAGDRFETMRPGYEIVKRQLAEGDDAVSVERTRLSDARTELEITTEAHEENTWFGLEVAGGYALQADSSGVAVEWKGRGEEKTWSGWLPHLDLEVARALTKAGPVHDGLWEKLPSGGVLTLRTQLDLWQMLHPAVQEGAQLDYAYVPETVTVAFSSSTGSFAVNGKQSTLGQVTHDVSLTQTLEENRWVPLEITLSHTSEGTRPDFTASWSTERDRRDRAFPQRRFLMPWVKPVEPAAPRVASRPELQGGHWSRGKSVFFGAKAQCSLCHQIRGEGMHIGPDLSNLPHRDYASVLRDIREPSASINPDYPTHEITLVDGTTVVAVPRTAEDGSVQLGVGPGSVLPVQQEAIEKSSPVGQSLMPAWTEGQLTETELKDLMTFLLNDPPTMDVYASLPRDGVGHAPPPRAREEIETVMAGAPEPPEPTKPLKITLVAGTSDHGVGEHDYPRWQKVWSGLFSMAEQTEVETAWQWPTRLQWEQSDVLVFFKRGDWDPPHIGELESYLNRGGGAVFIHWACEAGENAPGLSRLIGPSSNREKTLYRHGLVDLEFSQDPPHPVSRGFGDVSFHDESYWDLVGDPGACHVLATCQEEGETHPLFWTREVGPGRVFVSIPGHYSWTFDDPLFRTLLLRGIAWSAAEPVDRFNNLVEAGIPISR